MKPKSQFFLLLLLLVSTTCSSQTWFPDGAAWHHEYHTAFGLEGYVLMEAAGDTLVQGQPARKLARIRIGTYMITGTGFSESLSTLVVRESDGLVTIHIPELNTFDTLYQMNAVPGDHWRLPRLPDWRSCEDSSFVQVMDTGTVSISGISLRQLVVEVHFLIGDAGFVLPDTILERIGTTTSYFLLHDRCNGEVDGQEAGDFRCYNDAEIEYERDTSIACDFITGIPDIQRTLGLLSVWPNPSNGLMQLHWPGHPLFELAVRDAIGRTLLRRAIQFDPVRIDLNDLPPGVYNLLATAPDGEQTVARWILLQ